MLPLQLSRPLKPAVTVLVIDQTVAAGFPSPAEDHAQKRIDLNDVLLKNPVSSFLLRIAGPSMRDAGIDDGDAVIVDRALNAKHGDIVIAIVEGEFCVKKLYRRSGRVKLQAANPTFPDIVPRDGQTLEVWGVVTACIKRFVK